ncbi:PHP domain-containing protein [Candidatus Woesearchaeota archaeon]|nr:PHP domain-containing protein [Candidatus Woesearchaeota archaeon]
MLKTDLHIHTKEDPVDSHIITYSARDMIKYAAKLKYKVLSITNHDNILYNDSLKRYAKKHGILLISGTEAMIKGKEVLLLNIKKNNIKKISDLHKLRKQNALIIAPHPFYPRRSCLHSKLIKNIKNFDAIEYCHYYHKFFNLFNNKALKIARKYKKPIIGTSDAHFLYQMDYTYSLIDAEPKIDSVLEAIRKNKVLVRTQPLPLKYLISVGFRAVPTIVR